MHPDTLVALLNKFDVLRFERFEIAQKFVAQYTSNEELFADVANILALLYAANQIVQQPKGFQPDQTTFKSDTT